jgi:hypothetical protein
VVSSKSSQHQQVVTIVAMHVFEHHYGRVYEHIMYCQAKAWLLPCCEGIYASCSPHLMNQLACLLTSACLHALSPCSVPKGNIC